MRVLAEKDYKLLEQLFSLTQEEMRKTLAAYLKTKYEQVIIDNKYVMAIGDIPIALVAHMDTVHPLPVTELIYDRRRGVMWSPQGLGADDRAGIFIILKVLQSGLRPSIIFTADEERGGIGAVALSEKPNPIPNLKYLIQLDRRGTNDCVFYECDCPDFVDYIEAFGFCENFGSFSDISFLMPGWQTVGVNLSVGYEDEHTDRERLYIGPLLDTLKKVIRMLQETDIPNFKFAELDYRRYYSWMSNSGGHYCSCCHKEYSDYEMFQAKGLDGTIKHFCPDCIPGRVTWCARCDKAYELDEKSSDHLCKDCEEKVCTKTSKKKSKK